MCTFVNVSKHMDFWSNTTLNMRQKLSAASMCTSKKLQLEITMSCIQRLTQVHASSFKHCHKPQICRFFSCFIQKYRLLQKFNKCLANAKRPCDCRVLCLRLKSSLCSCAHSILDMTSFGCRDQSRDSVCLVL